MDQLPHNDDSSYSSPRGPGDHLHPQNDANSTAPRRPGDPLDEKGVASDVAIPIPDGDFDAFTATQPYRLYKRRWIGVFAMVSTPFPATCCR